MLSIQLEYIPIVWIIGMVDKKLLNYGNNSSIFSEDCSQLISLSLLFLWFDLTMKAVAFVN